MGYDIKAALQRVRRAIESGVKKPYRPSVPASPGYFPPPNAHDAPELRLHWMDHPKD